jgi:hypothetical protein
MLDVGGPFAGSIMGMSNTMATIPGIVGNIVTGNYRSRCLLTSLPNDGNELNNERNRLDS